MNFDYTPKVKELQQRLLAFFDTHIYRNEQRFNDEVEANRRAGNVWLPTRLVEELKPKARAAGLWNLSTKIIDGAIQMHGGGGLSDDFPLALMYAQQRTLRFADGPDEVHRNSIAKLEIARRAGAQRGA